MKMKSDPNIETVKQDHVSRLVPGAGLSNTTASNKGSRALGLLLGLFLCAALTAAGQPTVTNQSFYVDTWAGVVKMTVNFDLPLDYATASEPTNYVLQDVGVGSATLSNGTLDANGQNVTFDVTGVFGGDDYTLKVSGVQDQTGNTMVAANLTGTLPAIRFMILDQVGTATQSSNPFGYPASNARDDNINTYSHTFNNDNEWWELDLGTNAGPIGGLNIWFRQDCCYDRNHNVLFTLMDDNRAVLWTAYIDKSPPFSSPYMTNFAVGAPVMGRFVRIEHPPGLANQDFLHLGEVQLLGPSSGLVIGADPVSQTVPLGKPATFTVGVQGTAPITYQWKHAGTNIPGGTNATLLIASTKPTDAGSYLVVVTDGTSRQRTSASATLSIFVDSVPPTVTGHSWSQDTFKNQATLTVNFSEALNPLTATNPANYKFQGTSAVLGSGVTDGSNVTFVVSGPLSDDYILNVSGVKDLADNILVATNLTGTVPAMPYAYLGGIATQSTDPWGDHPWQARDGNIFTRAGTGGGPGGPGGCNCDEWWELDLGSPLNIGALVLWFRNDGSQQRDHDYVITIMDAARTTLWTGYIGQPLPSVDPRMTNMVVAPPVQGQFVHIQHPPGMAEFVTTTEVQVLSPPTHAVGGQNLDVGGSGSGMNLNWPVSGYIVQTNANLANSAGWGDLPGGNISPLMINAKSGSSLFYRLRKQAGWETANNVAFEAESTTNLVAGTPENWIVASDALASGGSALMVDGSTSTSDSPQSFAQYQIKCKTAGTYHIYYRWRANNPASSSDANSFWLATSFGAFSTSGDQTPFVVSASNGYSAPGDTTYQWLLDTPNYVVGAAEIASPPTLTFGTREAGMTIDRVVLSTSPSLTAADLDSLPNTQ